MTAKPNKSAPQTEGRACEVCYSGRVQGVGFRVNARQISKQFQVTGFVKNLPDGRVLLQAEGPPVEVDGFLEAVFRSMQLNIEHTTVTKIPLTGSFSAFEIAE